MTDGYDDLPPLVLPPHPAVYLADLAALKAYLRERKVDYYGAHSGRIEIMIDIGDELVSYGIDVLWMKDTVRFISLPGLTVPDDRLAEVALAVQRMDARRAFPLWSLHPGLAAVSNVTRNHDDTLSSRVFEYHFALHCDALFRDRSVLKALLAT